MSTLGNSLRQFAEKDGRGYPDWAIRYVPITRRLRRWGLRGKRIVEIGANENGLSRFSGERVIAVDIQHDHLMAARDAQDVLPVVASIDALPFRDDSVDVCASVDTFEHLPLTLRQHAVVEISRILRPTGVAVIAFPTGVAASQAEKVVRDAYRNYTGEKLKWLEEHQEAVLPDPGSLSAQFQTLLEDSHGVSIERNANVRAWRWMWLVMMCGWPGRGNALFQVLLRFVTPLLARMHFGDCYRAIVWVEPVTRRDA